MAVECANEIVMDAGIPFSAGEFAERVDRVRTAASAVGIDLLVVTDPKNIYYLTGYDAYAFYVPQALLVPIGGDQPVLVIRGIDVSAARWTTHLADDQIVGYGDDFIDSGVHPMRLVAEEIRAHGWHRGRVAVDRDGPFPSSAGLAALVDGLPDAVFSDADLLVERIRTVKSSAELDVMRQAGRIADHAMSTALNALGPGVSEAEIAASTYRALVGGIDGYSGSAPWRPYFATGARTNSPHLRWSDRRLCDGEPVMIELGGHRHHYAAGLSRTAYLGRPPTSYRELESTVRDGMAAALPVLRAGNTGGEVEAAWSAATAARGVRKNARSGYAIGISFPPTAWVEGTLSVTAGDRTVLVPGMTVHLMLAVWLAEFGYSLSETFIVTDAEPESLSRLDRALQVSGI